MAGNLAVQQRCECGCTKFEPVFKLVKPCWAAGDVEPPPIAVLRCRTCGKVSWAPPRQN